MWGWPAAPVEGLCGGGLRRVEGGRAEWLAGSCGGGLRRRWRGCVGVACGAGGGVVWGWPAAPVVAGSRRVQERRVQERRVQERRVQERRVQERKGRVGRPGCRGRLRPEQGVLVVGDGCGLSRVCWARSGGRLVSADGSKRLVRCWRGRWPERRPGCRGRLRPEQGTGGQGLGFRVEEVPGR